MRGERVQFDCACLNHGYCIPRTFLVWYTASSPINKSSQKKAKIDLNDQAYCRNAAMSFRAPAQQQPGGWGKPPAPGNNSAPQQQQQHSNQVNILACGVA